MPARDDLVPGRRLRLRIHARDVSLSLKPPYQSSILNSFPVRVLELAATELGPPPGPGQSFDTQFDSLLSSIAGTGITSVEIIKLDVQNLGASTIQCPALQLTAPRGAATAAPIWS